MKHSLAQLLNVDAITAEKQRRARNRISRYYPETGPLRRELYRKHLAYFAGGAEHEPMEQCPDGCTGKAHRERGMIAANRVGKTEGVGAYEVTLHLTGNYPDWWKGRRFNRPIKGWAAGDTNKTVRDILQEKLLGAWGNHGTGMIPAAAIADTTTKQGVAESIDTIYVRHVSGGVSRLSLKSYQEGRISFQGTEQDVIWLDEEPPQQIYEECLLRTMTTGGSVMLTFTPLSGLSDVVLSYMTSGDALLKPAKFLTMATWDDVPHLSQEVKDELFAAIPPYQRAARSKGVPTLGSGRIYPVDEEDIAVADFPIPDHWPRGFGLDVGYNRTAGMFGALDRDSDTLYLYAEHYRGDADPVIHTQAIKARGEWIRGAIDPASRGRSQVDGRRLWEMYRELGLDLVAADNSVETGLYRMLTRMSAGRLKVFRSCQNWFAEFRLYRRDEKGRVVKERDHLMDASRYLEMELLNICRTKPAEEQQTEVYVDTGYGGGWMS